MVVVTFLESDTYADRDEPREEKKVSIASFVALRCSSNFAFIFRLYTSSFWRSCRIRPSASASKARQGKASERKTK